MTQAASSAFPAAATPEALYQTALRFLEENNYEPAIQHLNQFLKIRPDHAPALQNLARSLLVTNRHKMALTAYRQALRITPNNPLVLNGISACYMAQGDFGKAITYFEKALRIDPHHVDSLYNMTLIKHYPPASSVGLALQRLHDAPECPDQAKVPVCFALGRIYEKEGDIRRAFQYYAEANRIQFRLNPYNEAVYSIFFSELKKIYIPELLEHYKGAGSQDNTPIFVLGMPRSGTSLIEQILASHPAMFGAGEVDIMPDIAERHIPSLVNQRYPHAVAGLPREQLRPLGEFFVSRLRSFCPGGQAHIIAKTPNNFFHIGLIRMLLPNARIIHCRRDPMDTCWSIYKQHFMGRLPYAYDQLSLGRFYVQYDQLMKHWHSVCPGAMYDISYETLISDPEPAIRALIAHCGLPWDEQCLSFYHTRRPVATASMQQVRRPIYKTSLKSWEPLSQELTRLREALAPCYEA